MVVAALGESPRVVVVALAGLPREHETSPFHCLFLSFSLVLSYIGGIHRAEGTGKRCVETNIIIERPFQSPSLEGMHKLV